MTETETTIIIGHLATVVSGDQAGVIVYVQQQNTDGRFHCELGNDKGYIDLDGSLLRSWKAVQSITNGVATYG